MKKHMQKVLLTLTLAILSSTAFSDDSSTDSFEKRLEQHESRSDEFSKNVQSDIDERTQELQQEAERELEKAEQKKAEREREKYSKPDNYEPDAGPMDFVIGESTFNDVKDYFDNDQIKVESSPNKITGGKSVVIKPSAMTIKNAKWSYFIFDDEDNKLVGVLMGLDKREYDIIKNHLDSKYQLVKEVDPIAGDKNATYSSDNAVIDIKSKHLEQSMELSYMTQEFKRQRASFNNKRENKQKESERSKF